jgi:hypothetical protein
MTLDARAGKNQKITKNIHDNDNKRSLAFEITICIHLCKLNTKIVI